MSASHATSTDGMRSDGVFEDTLWSRVFAAGRNDLPHCAKALEELCRAYWLPIYAFLRRWGHDRQDAHDLTQGFFAYLLEQNLIARADPDRGRFRSFLLGVLRNYASDEQDRVRAIKRGGNHKIVSIDEETAEGFYANEPATDLTPERLFERRWAIAVLEQAMERLKVEYHSAGMDGLFVEMRPWLTGDHDSGFAELGRRLQKSQGAVRVLVCRFRERFRKLIRTVIADTVTNVDEVETELRHLQEALRG
jgi:RNA polymerase sigma factor (sigma-70 family)